MTGREEYELKIKRKIEMVLLDMPGYVHEWYNNLLASGISIKTCDVYIHIVRNLLRTINYDMITINIDKLTPVVLDKFFISLKTNIDNNGKKSKASDSKSTTSWFALKKFFEFLTNRGYINQNYVKLISKPKNRDEYRINENRILLNKYAFQEIMSCASDATHKHSRRDILILLLFMTTGMRESALLSVDLKDIDLRKKKLYVIDKGEKRHEYILSDKTMNAIYDYLEERRLYDPKCEAKALFINKKKERISRSVLVNVVNKFTEEATGKKLSPHKLRAGFCSILYDEKHDIEFVRRAVGHSSTRTTQRYIVTDNKEKEEASNIMDKLF